MKYMATDRNEYIARNSEYNYNEDLVSFSLVDESTVRKLQKDGKVVLPQKKIDIPKDMRWNEKQMGSKLMQGIQNGYSIPKIANSLMDVIGNNKASATRNARTMTTSAENGGRLDSYKDLQARGVVQKKEWMATPDDRTRKSHIDMDGEEQDIDAMFSNGCMYPADGHGPSEEVWNCRCSMHTHILGFRRADGTISPVNYNRDKTMHDTQMDAERARRLQKAASRPIVAQSQAARPAELHGDKDAYDKVMKDIVSNGVKYKEVEELKSALSEQEIIEKLAGGDQTTGSCASLAFAYCANKTGLDVTDYRGGNSQKTFSTNWVISETFKTANANITNYSVKKEASDVAKILANIDLNKEYYLRTGHHASIIRRTPENGLEYLELQSQIRNGWMPFEWKKEVPYKKYDFATGEYVDSTRTVSRTVAGTLNMRFGCRKTADRMKIGNSSMVFEKQMTLVEVDSFQNTKEFKTVMGYINTDPAKQKKGASGGIK